MKVRSESEVRKLIRDLVTELAPSPSGISLENPKLVDDLQFNSLTLLELAFTIEDEFQLPPIDRAAAQGIVTARDIEDYVLRQLQLPAGVAASA
jgi:acyl carrier protein